MWVAFKTKQVALEVDYLLCSHLVNVFFLQHRMDLLFFPDMAEIQKMNKAIPNGIIMDSTLRYLSLTVEELD